MSPTLILALVQAAAAYGPPIVQGLKNLLDQAHGGTVKLSDDEILAKLDTLIENCKASDARIQAHVHKGDRT